MDGRRPDHEFVDDLVTRIEAARAASSHETERAEVLAAFVRAFRTMPDRLLMRCAWCGRIELEGRFVELEQYLTGGLPERLRERTTHGICPDCLERVAADTRTRQGSGRS